MAALGIRDKNLRVLLVILSFIATVSWAEPRVIEKNVFYEISPKSKNGFLREINSKTPISKANKKFHGHTNTYIKWRFWWSEKQGYCRMNRVEVDLEVTFTMPKITNVNIEVFEVWSAWYPNLENHENGHKAIGMEVARKIETGLRRLRSRSCSDIEAKANEYGDNMIKRMREMHQMNDAKTNHGETEGAFLSDHL